MMKIKRFYTNEKGFSLLEVTAAFVILIIILSSFYTFFAQSYAIKQHTKQQIDYTFLAQQQLEQLYVKTTVYPLKNNVVALKILGYTLTNEQNTQQIFTKETETATFTITMQKHADQNETLSRTVIIVKNNTQHTSAKLETTFAWRDS